MSGYDDKTITTPKKTIWEEDEEDLEPWEKGLKPVERFEKLVMYGQIGKLLKNSFFRSLDKASQVDALSRALDHLINQLDRMAMTLLKVSSTHPQGMKINRVAVALARLKVKLLNDFAAGVDIVGQIGDSSGSERYF